MFYLKNNFLFNNVGSKLFDFSYLYIITFIYKLIKFLQKNYLNILVSKLL
jgi:hypothetical protein